MRKSFIHNHPTDEDTGIDLTPMLDVVFIMLIFFIVTASFVKESGIDINRPPSTQSEKKDNTSILVGISADNQIWIDQRRIDIRRVKANITRLLAQNPQGAVVIQADALSNAKTYTAVFDAAKEAGAKDVVLAVDEA